MFSSNIAVSKAGIQKITGLHLHSKLFCDIHIKIFLTKGNITIDV